MKLIPGTFGRTRRFMLDMGQYPLLFGPVRRVLVERVAPHNDELLQLLICHYGRRLWRRGLIAGRAGNISARTRDPMSVFVTPRGRNKSALSPSQVNRVSLLASDEERVEISVEFPVHRACYLADPGVGAVVHSHAPALTALGLRGETLDEWLPEAAESIGALQIVPFRPSGSDELGASVGEAVRGGALTVILERHGVVTVGANLADAYDRMELAELSAHTVLLALH